MNPYQVLAKQIVSPDGKIIAEAKSFAAVSSDDQSEINQSVSVNILSASSSSGTGSFSLERDILIGGTLDGNGNLVGGNLSNRLVLRDSACSFSAQSGFGDIRREIVAGEGGNYARIFSFDGCIDRLEVSPPVPPENFVPGTASIIGSISSGTGSFLLEQDILIGGTLYGNRNPVGEGASNTFMLADSDSAGSFSAQSGFSNIGQEIVAGGDSAPIFGFAQAINRLELSPVIPPENFVLGTASIVTNLDTVILEGD
ncbi:hypothetical protein ACP6PL_06450 [Dapis sp. BLCC M126]|uniref:hypothetical protein n=1 Tax=Dapis sp. BLCC M126 TaxID=3400189 RepID=UPI003CEF9193